MLKKITKICGLALTSIIAIFVILLVLIKFGYFNSFIAKTVSNYASKNMNAEIHLNAISGNVFSKFNICDLSLSYDSDTIAYCKEIEIEYSLKQVLKKSIAIKKILITEFYFNAVQDIDSSWNFLNINRIKENDDSSKKTLDWNFSIEDFQLQSFILEVKQYEKNRFIPEYIELKARLKVPYYNDSITVNIDSVDIFAVNPDFEIMQIQGNLYKSLQNLSWDNLFIELDNSNISSNGKIDINSRSFENILVHLNPFDFEDIKVFFPELELYGNPEIRVEAKGNQKQFNLNLDIVKDNQKIKLVSNIQNIKDNPRYDLFLKVDSLDGGYWTQDEQFKSIIIGSLNAQGQGFDIKENSFDIKGQFGDIKYGDYSLKDLIIQTTKTKSQLFGSINSKTWIGNIKLKYNLQNIFDYPVYELYCDYQNLNLKGIPGIDSINTNLNGNISLKGKGKTLDRLNTKLLVNSNNSEILNYPINDFKINAYYNKGEYSFTGLHINTPYFLLDAEGIGNIYKSNNIKFEFSPLNIYDLISEFEIPIYTVNGIINGSINGAIDSLIANATVELYDIQYDSIYVEKLLSDFKVNIFDSIYDGLINLKADRVKFNGIEANNITLSNKFSNDFIQSEISLKVNDSLQAYFLGDIKSFENPLIRIQKLDVNYNKTRWINSHDSTYILLTPEYAYINRFNLKSGSQDLKLHGYFTFEGDEDIDIQIINFKLAQIPFQKFLPYSIRGNLTTNIKITGTSDNPIVKNDLYMDSIIVNNYTIRNLSAQLNYQEEMLSYNSVINSVLHKSIKASVSLPLHFSLSDEIYLLKDNPNFKANLRFDSLDINKIYSFYPIKDIAVKGLIFTDLSISNSINDPNFNGSVDLVSGNFENKVFGAYYNDIQLKAKIVNNQLALTKFDVKTNKKGVLTINGFINLKNDLAIIPEDFQLNIKSANFQALKSNRVELNFDTDLTMEGSFEDPRFKGNLKISRSRYNADYFGKYLMQKTDDPNPPLLISALQDTNLLITEEVFYKPGTKFSGTKFYKSLNGEALLQIPGNTWIRGKDMNFELEGQLRILKSTENLDLFGALKVKRGFYKIYGKSFTFNKGELTFTGGKEMNPNLDFSVIYRFRDIEKQLRKLTLNITGRLQQPILEFTLDDQIIEERDAIAYVVFGKSVNQLSENQLNKLMSNDNFALNLALDQLSNILKEKLQWSTRLDVVEITGENSWKNSSVTLGKYITNKLYLSYEQSFLLDKKSKFMDTEKLMLEYQLLRNIILKATNQNTNSGFDLILKKTWK